MTDTEREFNSCTAFPRSAVLWAGGTVSYGSYSCIASPTVELRQPFCVIPELDPYTHTFDPGLPERRWSVLIILGRRHRADGNHYLTVWAQVPNLVSRLDDVPITVNPALVLAVGTEQCRFGWDVTVRLILGQFHQFDESGIGCGWIRSGNTSRGCDWCILCVVGVLRGLDHQAVTR